MKKLLLTSTGLANKKIADEFLKLIDKELSDIKILVITTAARTDEEWKYVRESVGELEDLGIKSANIIEFNFDQKITYNELAQLDVIYICGGNTFYLLSKVREFNFGKKIVDLVNNQVCVFLGVSAGSILAGPNIDIASPWDKNEVGLTDLTALNLTNIIVSPHYVDEEKEIIDRFRKKYNHPIIPLTDRQALLIVGDESKIIQ